MWIPSPGFLLLSLTHWRKLKNSQCSHPHSHRQTERQGCMDLSDRLELKHPEMTLNAGVPAQTSRDGCLQEFDEQSSS